jgi:hypothetical protein
MEVEVDNFSDAGSDSSFDGQLGEELESSQMFQRMSQDSLNYRDTIFCGSCQIPTKFKKNRQGQSVCTSCKTVIEQFGTNYGEEAMKGSQRSKVVTNVIGTEKKLTQEEKQNLYISNFQRIIMKQIDSMIQFGFSKNLRFYFKDIWKRYVKKNMRKKEKFKLILPWHCLVFTYLCCMLTKEDVFLVDLKRLYSRDLIPFQSSLDDLSKEDVLNCCHPDTFYRFFSSNIPPCDRIWEEIGFVSQQLGINLPKTNCRTFLYKIYADYLLFPSIVNVCVKF